MLSRKDRKTGYKEEWGSRDLVPRISGSYKAYLANEVAVLDRVNKAREMAAKAGTMNQSAGAGDGAAGDVAPGSAGAGAAPGATQ